MTGGGLLMSQVALTTHLRLASLVLYSLWPLSCKTLPAWPLSLSLKKRWVLSNQNLPESS